MRSTAILLLTPWVLAEGVASRKGRSLLSAGDEEEDSLSRRFLYRQQAEVRLNGMASTVSEALQGQLIAAGVPSSMHAEAAGQQMLWLAREMQAQNDMDGLVVAANTSAQLAHLLLGPWFSLAGPTEEIGLLMDEEDESVPNSKVADRWSEAMHMEIDPQGVVTVKSRKCIKGSCSNTTKMTQNGNPMALSREERAKGESTDYSGAVQRALLGMNNELKNQLKSGYFTSTEDMFENAFDMPHMLPYSTRRDLKHYWKVGSIDPTKSMYEAGASSFTGQVNPVLLARRSGTVLAKAGAHDGSVFSKVMNDMFGNKLRGKAITSDTHVHVVWPEDSVPSIVRKTTRCEEDKCESEERAIRGVTPAMLLLAPAYEVSDA